MWRLREVGKSTSKPGFQDQNAVELMVCRKDDGLSWNGPVTHNIEPKNLRHGFLFVIFFPTGRKDQNWHAIRKIKKEGRNEIKTRNSRRLMTMRLLIRPRSDSLPKNWNVWYWMCYIWVRNLRQPKILSISPAKYLLLHETNCLQNQQELGTKDEIL